MRLDDVKHAMREVVREDREESDFWRRVDVAARILGGMRPGQYDAMTRTQDIPNLRKGESRTALDYADALIAEARARMAARAKEGK